MDMVHIQTSAVRDFYDEHEYETVVVMPSVKMALARRAANVLTGRTESAGLLIVAEDDIRLGFVATANYIYAKTHSSYFAYVAQDAFAGYYWLECALESIRSHNAGLLAFNDGRFFGELAAFGLVSRKWVNSLYDNFLFFPHYKRTYCDTELTDLARLGGKLVYNPHSMMVEVDYDKHRKGDSAQKENRIHYREPVANDPDGVLYVNRALTGFDGRVDPFVPALGPVSAVVEARRKAGKSLPVPDR